MPQMGCRSPCKNMETNQPECFFPHDKKKVKMWKRVRTSTIINHGCWAANYKRQTAAIRRALGFDLQLLKVAFTLFSRSPCCCMLGATWRPGRLMTSARTDDDMSRFPSLWWGSFLVDAGQGFHQCCNFFLFCPCRLQPAVIRKVKYVNCFSQRKNKNWTVWFVGSNNRGTDMEGRF